MYADTVKKFKKDKKIYAFQTISELVFRWILLGV